MITLAVPTYNQGGFLAVFLGNWRRWGAGLPLLIVDDGSTDSTGAFLTQADDPGLRILRIEHGGAAKARNAALHACSTEWIAFSDTDCLLDADYFRMVRTVPEQSGGKPAVEGAIVAPPGPKPPFTHSLFNATGGTYATANMAFHVPTLLTLGGFDEKFPANLREDSDLALTLREQTGAIPFLPDWKVCHPHVPRRFWHSLVHAWPRHAAMLSAEIRLYRKHPEGYSLIRRFATARATLKNWCVHWSWLYVRECGAYWRDLPNSDPSSRLRSLLPSVKAVVVAFWEQACIMLWCLRHRREWA